MRISSFNCFNYKANTSIVKKLFDGNDILYLIEHWLGHSEESLLKLIDNKCNLFFESDFCNSDKRCGRPFGCRACLVKENISVLKHIVYNK